MSAWLPFVVLTVLSWGMYIPTLHRGQAALGGSGVHAFLMVGLAYLFVAIAIPGSIIARASSWSVYTPSGIGFTIAAGGLWGRWEPWVSSSLSSTVGKPSVVPALVFAGASVISVFVAMLYNPPQESPSPLFFLGILMAAGGAGLVLANRPS